MASNEQLRNAKINKNDEFYTRIEDIAAEICNYKKHFEGKIVLCNCDDPEWSNFWVYFHQNFNEFKLKKLISTHYNMDGSPSYKMVYEGCNDADVKCWTQYSLKGDGDFRSEECVELLREADIIVTNPPFSLFKEYIKLLMEEKKQFVILGNPNAITYKEFFPLLKDNKLWIGYKSMGSDMYFIVSDEHAEELKKTKKEKSGYVIIDGKIYGRAQAIWYTNLDIPKRHISLVDELKYQYSKHPEWYPKYDNYNAINVGYAGKDKKLRNQTNKVDHIPYDYFGVMGVPITFFDKYNPDEFEIVGMDINDMVEELGIGKIGEEWIKMYKAQGGTGHITANMHSLVTHHDDYAASFYRRVLIKRKKKGDRR